MDRVMVSFQKGSTKNERVHVRVYIRITVARIRVGAQGDRAPLLICFIFLSIPTILLYRNAEGRWIYLNR